MTGEPWPTVPENTSPAGEATADSVEWTQLDVVPFPLNQYSACQGIYLEIPTVHWCNRHYAPHIRRKRICQELDIRLGHRPANGTSGFYFD